MSIQERLAAFLTEMNISTQQFERKSNMGVGGASKLTEKSYATTFAKIAKAYPQLNTKWLQTGEGEMLNNPAPIDFSRRDSDGDTLLNSVKTIVSDPKFVEQITKVEDRVCGLEIQVQLLNRLLDERERNILEKDERIKELKERIEELKKKQ